VCRQCGAILDPQWEHVYVYACDRKMLKSLVGGCSDSTFVWFLKLEGKIVRIGFGDLLKLYKETKPSPVYTRFDSVFIYWLSSEEERNVFATYSMANIEGVLNRKAVANNKYVGKMSIRFNNTVPMNIRQYVLKDPDIVIGSTGYWDIDRLREAGYVS
jgi:hypothetical protein